MHSSYFNVTNELPMNCRKKHNTIKLSKQAAKEIERISWLWKTCRSEYGKTGEWLFGDYSIADAMFSPFALRFDGYSIPLSGVEERYVKSVLNHPGIVEWIEAGKRETEVIESEEIVT
jgi:glutathione S-transferase